MKFHPVPNTRTHTLAHTYQVFCPSFSSVSTARPTFTSGLTLLDLGFVLEMFRRAVARVYTQSKIGSRLSRFSLLEAPAGEGTGLPEPTRHWSVLERQH